MSWLLLMFLGIMQLLDAVSTHLCHVTYKEAKNGQDDHQITFHCQSKDNIFRCDINTLNNKGNDALCSHYTNPATRLHSECYPNNIATSIRGNATENQCTFVLKAKKFSK